MKETKWENMAIFIVEYVHLMKKLPTLSLRNSTEKVFNQYGNKVSMFENVKKLMRRQLPRIFFLQREPTAALLSGYIDYSDEINRSLMIERDVTKNKKLNIGQLKDESVFLLNYVESTLHDRQIEIYIRKRKCEQAGSECNKWHS